ncbi:S8/S53 family peptidase [Streptomyces sp. NPDC048172]|uniref:S8/S53 family peptidase n=1 Tax=Streptomyces sp. NPDC048172 TaxID=3365505 RepID=UPI00371D6D35
MTRSATRTTTVTPHTVVPVPPRRGAYPEQGADPPVIFSTLVGPLDSLETVIARWADLMGSGSLRHVLPPRIHPVPPETPADARILRVAEVRHPPDAGPALVARLRRVLPGAGITDVVVERGYYLRPVAQGGTGTESRWQVEWRPDRLDMALRSPRIAVPPDALGAAFVGSWPRPRRIAVIDTGDQDATTQYRFGSRTCEAEAPVDHNGHGTSVASLVRRAAPESDLTCLRVFERDEDQCRSATLLCALGWATGMIDRFHVVGVPLKATVDPCEGGTATGAMHQVLDHNSEHGQRVPVVVCAAGNDGESVPMSYPATLPGVLVAVGLDWSGEEADYNCASPSCSSGQPHSVGAYGGVAGDPLGTRWLSDGRAKEIRGTSYATALVCGALAR